MEQVRPKKTLTRTRAYSPFKTPLVGHIETPFNSAKFISDSNLTASTSKNVLPHRIEDFHLEPLKTTRRCPIFWQNSPTGWGPFTSHPSQSELASLQTKVKTISVDSLTTSSVQASTALVADNERRRSNSSLSSTSWTYFIPDSRFLAPTPPLQEDGAARLQEGRTARWLPGNCNVVENQILCELTGDEWNSLLLRWVIVIVKIAFKIICFSMGAGLCYEAVKSILQPARAEPTWENIIELALEHF